ncbi:MAG: DUF3343 domain-containing protein [Clostridiales bacterium]|nr:DUF3343 domain-containing protein [Clostridiales bacterium]
MRSDEYYTMAFNSTHAAVAAEKYLEEKMPVEVMPTLRKITASCGISLRIETENFEKLKQCLDENTEIKKSGSLYFVSGESIRQLR